MLYFADCSLRNLKVFKRPVIRLNDYFTVRCVATMKICIGCSLIAMLHQFGNVDLAAKEVSSQNNAVMLWAGMTKLFRDGSDYAAPSDINLLKVHVLVE